jgi:hypothetical protein
MAHRTGQTSAVVQVIHRWRARPWRRRRDTHGSGTGASGRAASSAPATNGRWWQRGNGGGGMSSRRKMSATSASTCGGGTGGPPAGRQAGRHRHAPDAGGPALCRAYACQLQPVRRCRAMLRSWTPSSPERAGRPVLPALSSQLDGRAFDVVISSPLFALLDLAVLVLFEAAATTAAFVHVSGHYMTNAPRARPATGCKSMPPRAVCWPICQWAPWGAAVLGCVYSSSPKICIE